MKNLGKKIKTLVALISFVAITTFAQGTAPQRHGNSKNPILTKEQKEMLKNQRAVNLDRKKALRATFSGEQLDILESTEMTRRQKREALQASFTSEQLAIIETNKQARRADRNAFEDTLTDEQKQQFRTHRRHRKALAHNDKLR